MFRNQPVSPTRWWMSGSEVDPAGSPRACSIPELSSLKKPIPLLLKDHKRPDLDGILPEWIESGASPEDDGRAFELSAGPRRRLLLYQLRKSETNAVRALDLAVCFPGAAAIHDIRSEGESLSASSAIHQGEPIVLVGDENAYAVRMRATHPDLRRIPLRFEEHQDGLLLIMSLVDFGVVRQLRDDELARYSALVTLEEKKLNNPRALEGFQHDLANQEVWDDFSGQVFRRAGFIGNGFKLSGTINQSDETWVDRFVIGQ
ncbi:MAG: hypothetical protein KC917_07145 [Candidatus Omnitrophica bacterium]|nr:hypothetical protein [Candidatus Omnitrophota bacterium]